MYTSNRFVVSFFSFKEEKRTFLAVLGVFTTKMILPRKLGGTHFSPSICGKNMSIYGQPLLPQKVILNAKLLVQAQNIPQNARCTLFI